jgi:glutamate-1-semialdehyde 2,1-aminomutase
MSGEMMNPDIPLGWTFTEADRALAAELQPRLPERLFDVHAHLFHKDHISPYGAFYASGPPEYNQAVWRHYIGGQVGVERLCGARFTPHPSRDGDPDAANEYVAAQVDNAPGCAASILVYPKQSRAAAEALLENPKVRCFKPYHVYSGKSPSFECTLEEYVPEWAWELAEERGLVILLHMVRLGALSDPQNQKSIVTRCEKYPNARLLLAHAARGFNAPSVVKGISALRGLENVWFDSAAICEAEPFAAILDEFGPRRLLWGTDFPVSQERGRAVTLGTGFVWVATDQMEWNERAFFGEPVMVGLESLRAFLDAADGAFLSDEELQDVFCDNALRLLGMKAETVEVVQDLYREAKTIIPGGTQLLSKRPEMEAPDQWPAYFREARGCEVWDLDGRHYYDVGKTGISACLLGFGHPEVTRAVQHRIARGSFCTLSPPEEVELARLLCELHPWAEQVRYARTGGEIMSIAARIARATTDRSLIAICGYHGWHDWYLAANLGESDALRGHLLSGLDPLGVPRELRGTALTFTYNNREELTKILDEHGDRLAAVVMEPCRHRDPEPGFLEFVRDEAHRVGALLVFDEVSIGWRLALGGAHLRLGVSPDIAVFAKSIANGHAMAAVIGTREAMEGAHTSFISSTYWTEGIGPAAALATIRKMQEVDVPAHCERIGRKVQDAWRAAAERHGLPVEVEDGYPALANFAFEHALAAELKTLYIQLTLERGYLAGLSISVTLAHTDRVIGRYAGAIDEVFAEIADALEKDEVKKRLKGPVAHSGFQRLL